MLQVTFRSRPLSWRDISVKILSVQAGDKVATVAFRQTYKSDTLKSSNTKTLKLVRSGDRWLIKQERAGG